MSYAEEELSEKLASMSVEYILALREKRLTEEQREAEARAKHKMDDPVGTVRIYGGFDDSAFLVRHNEDDVYPEYADEDDPSTPDWKIFWDYRADEHIEDWQLDRNKLSDPVVQLTPEQLKELLS